jgi:hypothetical protein
MKSARNRTSTGGRQRNEKLPDIAGIAITAEIAGIKSKKPGVFDDFGDYGAFGDYGDPLSEMRGGVKIFEACL